MSKKRLNFLDIAILLFAVLILAGGTWFFASRNKKTADAFADGDTTIVVLEVKKQYGAFEKMLTRGEILYDNIQNVEFGELVDYTILPAEETAVSQIDGEVHTAVVPDRYDFHLSIRVPSDEKIVVGKNLSIKAKLYKCSGYVIDVIAETQNPVDSDSDSVSDSDRDENPSESNDTVDAKSAGKE